MVMRLNIIEVSEEPMDKDKHGWVWLIARLAVTTFHRSTLVTGRHVILAEWRYRCVFQVMVVGGVPRSRASKSVLQGSRLLSALTLSRGGGSLSGLGQLKYV